MDSVRPITFQDFFCWKGQWMWEWFPSGAPGWKWSPWTKKANKWNNAPGGTKQETWSQIRPFHRGLIEMKPQINTRAVNKMNEVAVNQQAHDCIQLH